MTIRDQLNRLPHPYNELAIANCDQKYLIQTASSVLEALYEGFVWGHSPQGHQFWACVKRWADYNLDNTPPSAPSLPSIP